LRSDIRITTATAAAAAAAAIIASETQAAAISISELSATLTAARLEKRNNNLQSEQQAGMPL